MTNLSRWYSLNRQSILTVLLCSAMLLSACGLAKAASDPDRKPPAQTPVVDGSLQFLSSNGQPLAAITIELAETPNDWSKGLMDRQEMGQFHGMLFIFDVVKPRGFWMRNTYIPLDIIFIDENKRVVTIAENTTPLSEQILSSGKPVRYVVEVNAGFSQRFHIEKGTQIRWHRQ